MADEQDKNDERLDVTDDDDDAEQLLADAVDTEAEATETEKAPAQPAVTEDKNWKAEAEKWRSLSRKNEKSFKDAASKLREFEDANKSESERLQEDRDSHKTRAEKAEAAIRRREIAEEVAPEHASLTQIKAVAKRLAGDSEEDLEADARELFALLASEPKAASKMPAPPRERLRGGSEPDDDPEPTDPRKLAALIPRRR